MLSEQTCLLIERKNSVSSLRKAWVTGDFISEPGIVRIEDLPEGWGLLHVVKGRVKVHGWPVGNCDWCVTAKKPFKANKQAECDYMFSALRRLDLHGHLNRCMKDYADFGTAR